MTVTTRVRKLSVAGVAAAGAAAAVTTLAPTPAHAAPAKPDHAVQAAHADKADKADASNRVAKIAKDDKYKENLDGWIRQSLAIMKAEGIPGSYEGLHRNIMRESGGDPKAVNDWDVNAKKGIPSKGLLQVIEPTFDAYHVKGTKKSQTDPVANITAAANYAADRYGSIDKVDSAY